MTPTEQRIASIKANPDLLRTDMDWLLSQLELAGRVVEALERVSALQDKVLDARDALMACGGIRDANYWAWHDVHINASGDLLVARQALRAYDLKDSLDK